MAKKNEHTKAVKREAKKSDGVKFRGETWQIVDRVGDTIAIERNGERLAVLAEAVEADG